jgi:mercuric ion transport protein
MAIGKLERAGSLGAIVAAVVSSLCCILPVLAAIFGLGAFGIASVFETLRPYFLVLAVAALGFSFYQVYFREEACEPGEACATKTVGRMNKMMIWFALLGALAIAAFPYYSAYVLAAVDRPSAVELTTPNDAQPAVIDGDAQNRKTVVIGVTGMTCEDCATHLNVALKRVKGVISAEASYPKKNVTVIYDPRQVTLERIRQGIHDAGYDPV